MQNTNRDLFHANGVLCDDQVRSIAPSVYSSGRNLASTSERYSFLSTSQVINPLRDVGWNVVGARQLSTARGGTDPSFQKHMVVLAHAADLENYSYAKACPRIILTNAHDGGSAFQLRVGLFRLACANGLIVSGGLVREYRIRHTNRTTQEVVSAALALRSQSGIVQERVEAFQARDLDLAEQIAFARLAVGIRYGEEQVGVSAREILAPRRIEDRGNDLWRVFNRVQEAIVRGGFKATRAVEGWGTDQRRAKEIRSIDELTRVNTQLWEAADGLVA
jgi:hypothetical protein